MSKQKIRDSSEENICYILWTKVGDTSGKEPACLCRRCKRCGFDLVDQEDPLDKGKTTHSSTLAWRISWTIYIYIVHRVAKRHN